MSNSGKAEAQAQMLKRLEKLEGLFAKQTFICQVRVRSAMEGLEGGGMEAVDAGSWGRDTATHLGGRILSPWAPLLRDSSQMPKCSLGNIAKTVVKRFSHWKM